MRSLGLAVRGLWWRRWSSLALLVVATACAGIAAAGPAFAIDSRDAVLQAVLRSSPTQSAGTGVTTVLDPGDGGTRADLVRQVQAFRPLVAAGLVRAPVIAEQGEKAISDALKTEATMPIAYRSDACRHVRLLSGTCVDEKDPTGVLVTAETARLRHWKLGTEFAVSTGAHGSGLHVLGIYEPLDPEGEYWFDSYHGYFHLVAQFASSKVQRGDMGLVSSSFWAQTPAVVGDQVAATADVSVVLDRLHVGTYDRFRTLVTAAVNAAQEPFGAAQLQVTVVTGLPGVFDRVGTATRSVTFPILVVAVQLVILSWLVLYLVLVGAAEGRTSEVVLGKLRGLRPRETLAHALLEPLLIVVAAVPLGVLIADVVLARVAGPIFGSTVQAQLPPDSWRAGAAAGLGGAFALAAAGVSSLRRSVIDQWRRAERRPRRRGWVLDAIVLALAGAGFVDLAAAPAAQNAADANAQYIASAAPALLAVAVALVTVRIIPRIARAFIGRTPGLVVGDAVRDRAPDRSPTGRPTGLPPAGRVRLVARLRARQPYRLRPQPARPRPDGGRRRPGRHRPGQPQARPVRRGRAARPVRSEGRRRLPGAVTVAVPSGLGVDDETSGNSTALIVDPQRFGAVAFWRSDFAQRATLATRLTPLLTPPPSPVRITGTRITVATSATVRSNLPVVFRAGLTDADGTSLNVRFGTIAPTAAGGAARALTLSASVPGCATGCLLRSFSLQQDATADTATLRARLTIRHVLATVGTVSTDVLPALRASTWVYGDITGTGAPAEQIDTTGGVLTVDFVPTASASGDDGFSVLSGMPPAMPALVTSRLIDANRSEVVVTFPNSTFVVSSIAVDLLPRAGPSGLVMPRSWLPASNPSGFAQYAPNQVWLAPDAPADFPARLAAAGVSVVSTTSAAQVESALGDQGPSFAVAMLLFGGLAAGTLAIAGAAMSLLIASRRRLYEIAAVRSLGLSPRRVLTSLVVEQGVIALLAAAVGVVGARVALDKLPEFADQPGYPPLRVDLPVALCIALAAAVVVAVVLVGIAGGASLVRRASPSRLREAQT